jgi:polyferredoxin
MPTKLLSWRLARRIAQFASLALFLYLLRATEYAGQDTLSQPVNLFFRLDPLNAAAAMLASRTFLLTFWPAFALLLLTALAGRFFCGWICPLGTLLDYFHRLTSPISRRTNRRLSAPTSRIAQWRPLRYALLIIVLLSSLFCLPIVGYLDPFGLLFRGFTLVLDPASYHLVSSVAPQMDSAPASLQSAYNFIRNHALPFRENLFPLVGLTAAIFAALFALEFVAHRFWCRYLCPLGALLGIAGRWSFLRRLPAKDCGKCQAASKCSDRCRMGAFTDAGQLIPESCNLCMDCLSDCPQSIAKFKFKKPHPATPIGLSRRGFLTASALGLAVPAIAHAAGRAKTPPNKLPNNLLRPPGVADALTDASFLNFCIRCGECLKVCTTNGLVPSAFESGLAGLFSPTLSPRQGYCEFACTLCGQVCPTGAIPLLTTDAKKKAVIGKAAFDRSRCLPWAKNEECLCCEEHCPVESADGDKAIQFDIVKVTVDGEEKDLQRPYVVQDRCIGCGICENKCPLDGSAGIHVYRKESAPKESPHMSPATAPSLTSPPV